MRKLTIIGHFGSDKNFLDGQTVKTKIVAKELQNQLGVSEVYKIDTYGGKKALPKLFFKSVGALKKSQNLVILPAHNGLKFFVPVLSFFNKIFKRKLYYIVIGGWLAEYLNGKKGLEKKLKKFSGIFVETSTMKKALEEKGFQNVSVMPNCKELNVLLQEELVYPEKEPYKLCTFSRVCKQKGIENAVNAVIGANERFGRTVYSLDIYGQVDEGEVDWFSDLQKTFPDYIRYGGLVPFDKSVEVLKDYFALLFPTLFYTEGIPGTIIDAFAAGLPIISSKWLNYNDILDDSVCIGYDFEDTNRLNDILLDENLSERILKIKKNCLSRASEYLPKNVVKEFLSRLN
ncbi:MAG: glycosyltransferase [Clostridia bacterium]|nr:glycosyltransferase [Clostridia bacterium]